MGLKSGIGLKWYGAKVSFLIEVSCVWLSAEMSISNLNFLSDKI